MSQIAVKSAVPILFVRDVSASAAFFQEKLEFQVDFLYDTPPFKAHRLFWASRMAHCLCAHI